MTDGARAAEEITKGVAVLAGPAGALVVKVQECATDYSDPFVQGGIYVMIASGLYTTTLLYDRFIKMKNNRTTQAE